MVNPVIWVFHKFIKLNVVLYTWRKAIAVTVFKKRSDRKNDPGN